MHRESLSRIASHVLLATTLTLAVFSADAGNGRKIVQVADVATLYTEIARPQNAGALLVLGRGPYPLDPTRPNGGRLELQQDMGLQGVSGDAGAVVIDAQMLLPAQFASEGGFPTGAIRLGRGKNSVEWLTVQNTANGTAAITTDLAGDSSPDVRVAYVVARAGQRGLDARNLNAPGRKMKLEAVGNQFLDNTAKVGQGLRILNSNSQGARIKAQLSGNLSSGNTTGCIVSNLNSSDADIDVQSAGDSFVGNANGCIVLGGLAQGDGTAAQDNTISFDATGDSFFDNVRPLPATFAEPGGLLVIGGQSQGADAHASGNMVGIDLHDAQWGTNQGWDMQVWGAQTADAQPAGTDNEVTVRLRGTAAQAWTTVRPSAPVEAAGTNTTSISR
ncbi:MAG TPA: hypothetical protein VMH39_00725 [Gemmatimonadaceae bacterium]|nr:hypothetical protein [Gemmatimonadaceae bacterium]